MENYEVEDEKSLSYKDEETKPNPLLKCKSEPISLQTHEFSLEKDALLGWVPKLDKMRGPLPFYFGSHEQVKTIRRLEAIGSKLVYRSQRPFDTFGLHKRNLASGSLYEINDVGFTLMTDKNLEKLVFRRPGDQPDNKGSFALPEEKLDAIDHSLNRSQNLADNYQSVSFDSEFEGGNLDLAFEGSKGEFDLMLRCDPNTRGHNQWFYFEVIASKDTRIRLNIINMVKPKTLFGKGGFPYLGTKPTGSAWVWTQMNNSSKTVYARTHPRFELSENDRIYMTLSFSLDLFKNNPVRVAYSIPYSYSDLLSYLNEISFGSLANENPRTLLVSKFESRCLKIDKLCKGESLLDVPILSISDFEPQDNDPLSIIERPIVYVVSRVHPSETVASFSVEGFINKILDTSAESLVLRKLFQFKIVPMMNPDGVILGTFRTNLSGDDLNRRYDQPSNFLHPTVL